MIEKPTGREFRVAVETWPEAEEISIRSENDGMNFSGYAAVFNSESEDLGGFRETVDPAAFAKTLSDKRAIRMFQNHNSDIVLGSTRSNVELVADDRGLLTRARLPETTAGRDMAILVRDKIVDSMSFGFQVIRDAWYDAKGNAVPAWEGVKRTLLEVRLFEVSPVTGWPAYPKTSASVRELAETIDAEPDALAEAFAALRGDANLTDEQHALLFALINARHESKVVSAEVADYRARFAAKGYSA